MNISAHSIFLLKLVTATFKLISNRQAHSRVDFVACVPFVNYVTRNEVKRDEEGHF